MNDDLKLSVGSNERIMWEGKPNKKCYIFEAIFNPLMPFAIIWAVLDLGFIGGFTMAGQEDGQMLWFLIPFFALHLMPVWIYLGGVLMSRRSYKNTYYIVTDRAIYVSQGVLSKRVLIKPFAEMSHINLHRGVFDQMFNVGDIVCTSSQRGVSDVPSAISISSISDYANVLSIVKKLQQDIYSDMMYPNDKRPTENHGYNTEYKGL